jgi:AcrR family transcriptional regulator
MRRRPRRDSGAFTVDSVLDAAELVIERHGLAGFTTNRVAEVAGVSIGSIYQYFPNKFALAAGVHARYADAYRKVCMQALERGGAMRDIVLAIARGLNELFVKRPRVHRAMSELRTAAEMHERIAELHAWMIATASAWFERRGATPERAQPAAFVLVHAIDGIANAIANRADAELAAWIAPTLADLVEALASSAARA